MSAARTLLLSTVVTVVILAIVAGGAWLARPYVLKTILLTVAAQNGLHSVSIDIDSVHWDRTTVRRIAAVTETEYGPVSLELHGLTVRYRPADLALESVRAEAGAFRWSFKSADTPIEDRDTSFAPLPVLPPMQVARATIVLESVWGLSRFEGALAVNEEQGHYTMRLTDERQSVEMRTDKNLESGDFSVRSGQNPVVAAKLRRVSPTRIDIEGTAQLHHLRDWSHSTALAPEALQRAVQSYLVLDNGSVDIAGHLELDGVFRIHGQGTGAWQGWKQDAMTSDGRLSYRGDMHGDAFRIDVLPRSEITLHDVRWGDDAASISIPRVNMTVEAEVRARAGDAGWNVEHGGFRMRMPELVMALNGQTPVNTKTLAVSGTIKPSGSVHSVELTVSAAAPSAPSLPLAADQLQASVTFETDRRLRARGTFTAAGVRVPNMPQFPRNLSLAGSFKGRDRVFTAEGGAQIEKLRVGTWRFASQPPSGARLTTAFEVNAANLANLATPLLGKPWADLAISAGAVSGNAEFVWNGAARGTMTVSAAGVAGRYQQSEFQDVGVEVTSDDVLDARYRARIRVEHGQIASGIPISDFHVDVQSEDDQLILHAVNLRALGGFFELRPATLSMTRADQQVTMQVTGLDFGQVLQTLDRPELSGSGRLDATIPLQFTQGGPRIRDAEFQSTTAGTLRYTVGTDAAPQTDNIALRALNNFQYDAMRVRVNYEPEGDYRIRVRLEGRNPNLYEGYPIAFNLNITGELPGLLRAGLFSGDFSAQILKNVQSERLAQ